MRIKSGSAVMACEKSGRSTRSLVLENDFNILLSVDETDDMETDRPNSPAIALWRGTDFGRDFFLVSPELVFGACNLNAAGSPQFRTGGSWPSGERESLA